MKVRTTVTITYEDDADNVTWPNLWWLKTALLQLGTERQAAMHVDIELEHLE